jgi:diguanylate cyclase (GGDEF)-like protein
MGSELILPIPMGGARGVQGLGGLFHQGAHAFSAEETALFSTFVGGIASSYLVYHSYRQIEAQSNTDPLTGLANRRGLFKELEEMLRLARRERQAISLILVDVDHFKSINDRYGHKVGDEVLQQLAGYLRQGSREMDVVARFGGEEFLLLLPGVDAGAALEIAERIRSDVASLDMDVSEELRPKVPPGGIRVTLSLGIGSVQPGEAPDLVIRRVDEALYRAKGGGRNRVVTESWAEG